MHVGQRTLDDLGTPLAEVTFCVIDLETTGTDRGADAITEIGMVKVRGGELLGTLATLVDPGCAVPPQITLLTGITDAMLVGAPRIDELVPTVVEFVGDAVIVGHNVSFDLGFLNTALRRCGHEPFGNRVVDTLPLARRLVRDEVPNCRLGTLVDHLRLPHRPTHRALDDAVATTDLLHLLLERAGTLGVLGLDDLMHLPTIASHPQAGKLALTDALPRSPGVYRFVDATGQLLYVGKATNVRQRVRSYFGGDDRRKVGALLRQTHRIEHTPTSDAISAEVLESRYLHATRPRFNRAGTTWERSCYVRLPIDDPWPRLMVVAEPAPSGIHLGPLPSRAVARTVVEAIQTALPIRRCTTRPARRAGTSPCHAAVLGVALCPCASGVDRAEHASVVDRVVAALTDDPSIVLAPLWQRIERLAVEQRFEEAALARDRAHAFAQAVIRQQQADHLRAAGDIGVRIHDTVLHIVDGVLVGSQVDGGPRLGFDLPAPTVPPLPAPLPRDAADEVRILCRAIERASDHARVVWSSGGYALPLRRATSPTRLDLVA